MDDENDNEHRGLVGWILGIAVALSITVALTSGIVATTGGAAKAPAAASTATSPTAASPTAAPTGSAARTAPADPAASAAAPAAAAPATAAPAAALVARIYFDSGATALPADAGATLGPIIDAARANAEAKLAISGFHDQTGSPERNAELAKLRAFAVRDALVAAGIAEPRIELRKPVETAGGVDDREARRVEVTLQ